MIQLKLKTPNLILGVCIALSGCEEVTQERESPARPVTYLIMKESNPARLNRLTGSVESWKKEMLSFRVAGRVIDVVEPDIDIEGSSIDAQNQTTSKGTVLAKIQPDTYQIQLDESKAALNSAIAQVTLAQTELERVIPEQIKASTAALKQKKADFERKQKLIAKGALTKSEFDISESELRQAEAVLAKAKADLSTKSAEIAALKARVSEAEQQRLQAEINLKDCTLYSPFTGQISKVHAISGSYLYEGMPIVTVQMMDPIKVEIAVSQDTDQRVRYQDQLNVYLGDRESPVPGFVYLKDTVADAATRTFNLTILIRNRRVEIGLPEGINKEKLPYVTNIYNLESEKADNKPPYFTDEFSIHKDSQGRTFVWKINELKVDDLRKNYNPVFTVKKEYIKLGKKTLPIMQLYRGREISDLGKLDPLNDLVTGRLPQNIRDGDKVYLSRKEWLLRPGQLVEVELPGQSSNPGFYIPNSIISERDGNYFVFTVNDVGSGQETAKQVKVRKNDVWGEYVRIESLDDGAFVAGKTKLIFEGVHYLKDGDPINAFEEVEVSL